MSLRSAAELTRYGQHVRCANAALFRNRQHAFLGPQQDLYSLFDLGGYARTPELLALFDGPFKPRVDRLLDHTAFGKRTGVEVRLDQRSHVKRILR
jgi:hypothetical protein